MQRNTIVGGAVLLVIIAGGILFLTMQPAPAKAPGTVAPVGIVLPANGYVEHAKYYDIAANYAYSTPLLVSAGALADATARSLMLGFVRDTITAFKADGNFDNLTSKDIQMMGFDQGRKEKLQIVYMIGSSSHTLSYIFTIYEDTLGAHGNTFFHTFTFDTKTGAALALADLFTPGATYLDTLTQISRAKLPTVIGPTYDMTFIKDGTTPTEKNFSNFFFDNQELVFVFPPYQVAPYSAGPQTLRIPLSSLSTILKPEYR